MAETIKATIQGSSLQVTNTEAVQTVRYYVDGITGDTPMNLERARGAQGIPRIGEKWTQPIMANLSGFAKLHILYCMRHQVTPPGRHPGKWFVDVEYRSAPAPTIEFATGLVQKKSDLYLTNVQYTSDNDVTAYTGWKHTRQGTQEQIQLTYYLPPSGIPDVPGAQDRRRAAAVSRYFYSDSFRIAVTRFGDMDYGRALQQSITGCINSARFQRYPARTILCTGCQLQSGDGGWSYRIIPEFLYNVDSWDGLAVSVVGGDLALLTPDTQKEVLKFLIQQVGPESFPQGVPKAVNPKNGGAGRFPLYPAVNFSNLIPEIVPSKFARYLAFDNALPKLLPELTEPFSK